MSGKAPHALSMSPHLDFLPKMLLTECLHGIKILHVGMTGQGISDTSWGRRTELKVWCAHLFSEAYKVHGDTILDTHTQLAAPGDAGPEKTVNVCSSEAQQQQELAWQVSTPWHLFLLILLLVRAWSVC
jgi:hypothetical protein